jgi:predicted NBD/HSP70 family sugar kinase
MPTLAKADSTLPDSTHDLARAVLIHGPVSRTELSRLLGLSLPTLTRLTKPLLERGILFEMPDVHEGLMGRPVRPLDVRADVGLVMGVKLTGDVAFGVVTDLKANPIGHAEKQLPDRSVSAVVRTIVELRRTLERQVGDGRTFTALGVSVGGLVRDDGTIAFARYLGWSEVDLISPLRSAFEMPVFLENDVLALTAAEHWFGEGRGLTDFALVTVGAGVGYGLVQRDRVVSHHDARVGTAGHIRLQSDGPSCADGHVGCSTALLSIPGMCGDLSETLGRVVEFDELMSLARAGEPAAVAVVERAAWSLGFLAALVANFGLVDTIVLGGEGMGWVRDQLDRVTQVLADHRDPSARAVTLLIDDSDFVAWARGAAAVAIQASFDRTVLRG